MTKYDYLTRLKHHLQPLPYKERVAVIKHYEKVFADAGVENEGAVIAKLGLPAKLAQKILESNPHTLAGAVKQTKKNVSDAKRNISKNKSRNKSCLAAGLMMLGIFLGVAVLALVLLAFAFFVVGALVCMAAGGIALICISCPYIVTATSLGLLLLGLGIMCISFPVLIFMPSVNFVFFVIKKVVAWASDFLNMILKGERKAAVKK